MKTERCVLACVAALFMTAAGLVQAQSGSPFPLGISGRHLVDAGGAPFLLHGDTAWSLIVQLTREETEEYLENRRQKGFNTILVNVLTYKNCDAPPNNKYGDGPFVTPGELSTPKEPYFAHMDWVLQKAAEKGILVLLLPFDLGWGDKAWGNELENNTLAACRGYGRYLGNRYKNYTNIVWITGGDHMPPVGSDGEQKVLEILLGIKDSAPGHLWSAHWARFSTASDSSTFTPYMKLDSPYGGNRSYIQTLRAYKRTSPMPAFYIEGYYEGLGLLSTPEMMRAQAYWALLSGATGHVFGSNHIWPFGAPVNGSGGDESWDWRAGMDRQPSREMVHVKALFQGRAWHTLVPDQNHSVVTAGYGTFGVDDRNAGGNYVTAARTGDGSLVMAYVPSTGTGTRTITVDMARLSGSTNARWYNPTSAVYTTVSASPFANSGSRNFTTPGNNGTGTNDWVLVLETTPVSIRLSASPINPSRPDP